MSHPRHLVLVLALPGPAAPPVTAALIALIARGRFAGPRNSSTSSHTSPPAPARTTPAPRPKHDGTPRTSPVTCHARSRRRAGPDLGQLPRHAICLPRPPPGRATPADGLASGFADTPQGALLAAVNIGVRTAAQWGTAIFVPTINHQVTGPATPALLHAEETAYAQLRAAAHVARASPPGKGNAAETGYRFLPGPRPPRPSTSSPTGPPPAAPLCSASTRIQVVWQAR